VRGDTAADDVRQATLAFMRDVAAPGLPPAPDPDETEG
jgi:hypothetical protein